MTLSDMVPHSTYMTRFVPGVRGGWGMQWPHTLTHSFTRTLRNIISKLLCQPAFASREPGFCYLWWRIQSRQFSLGHSKRTWLFKSGVSRYGNSPCDTLWRSPKRTRVESQRQASLSDSGMSSFSVILTCRIWYSTSNRLKHEIVKIMFKNELINPQKRIRVSVAQWLVT